MIDIDTSKLIFMTGAPGCKWSAISWLLSEVPELNIDKGDRRDDQLMVHDKKYNGTCHTGAYFGPGMELGHNFHNINTMSKEEICTEIKKAWPDWDDSKQHIVRCHQFINNFDWLVETFPESKFVIVTRNPGKCIDGWETLGGFDIPYPNYKEYYKDTGTARKLILSEVKKSSRAFFDYNIAAHVACSGHFREKWGLYVDDPNGIEDHPDERAKYLRAVEGWMYREEDPYNKLKYDVTVGYLGF
jgi:hypothetical protein